jgi:hypothetical protein
MKFFMGTDERRGDCAVFRAADGQEWIVPTRMLDENNVELWPVPEAMQTDELRPYASEYVRRIRRGRTARPKVMRKCEKCGVDLGSREMRQHKCNKPL